MTFETELKKIPFGTKESIIIKAVIQLKDKYCLDKQKVKEAIKYANTKCLIDICKNDMVVLGVSLNEISIAHIGLFINYLNQELGLD